MRQAQVKPSLTIDAECGSELRSGPESDSSVTRLRQAHITTTEGKFRLMGFRFDQHALGVLLLAQNRPKIARPC